MTDELDNVVLEHLRHIRRKVDGIDLELGETKSRVGTQEEIGGQILSLLGVLAKRMDRTEERLSRIERRLELVEV